MGCSDLSPDRNPIGAGVRSLLLSSFMLEGFGVCKLDASFSCLMIVPSGRSSDASGEIGCVNTVLVGPLSLEMVGEGLSTFFFTGWIGGRAFLGVGRSKTPNGLSRLFRGVSGIMLEAVGWSTLKAG